MGQAYYENFDDTPRLNGAFPLYPLIIPPVGMIRPRPWLYGFWLMRGAVTLIAAPGGTGKTSLVTSTILACATGRDLLGMQPLKQMVVAFLGLEESAEEMHRRFAAAMIHHVIAAEDFADRVFYLDGRNYGFSAANMSRDGQIEIGADMGTLTALLRDINADILVADPLALAHSAPENDNGAMARVIGYFNTLAATCDCAVCLIHHTRKGAQAGDPDGIRGAGALINHARIAIGLSPATDADREAFQISKEDARRLVRIDDLKLNYSPRAFEARWLKLESVRLGNITADYPQGDSVQVPMAWSAPLPAAGITIDQANEILNRIDLGIDSERYCLSGKSPRAAYRLIQTYAAEQGIEKSEAWAKSLVSSWYKNNVIKESDYDSPEQRKTRKGLFVNNANRPGTER